MEPRISIITLGVKNMSIAYEFYTNGLGFTTSNKPEQGIIFLKTQGCCLALYPYDKLAEDALQPNNQNQTARFTGITLAHNTHSKEAVEQILQQANQAGGKIIKPAQDTFWGGYHGYFADPDGYIWEVAYGADWQFNPDGSLQIP